MDYLSDLSANAEEFIQCRFKLGAISLFYVWLIYRVNKVIVSELMMEISRGLTDDPPVFPLNAGPSQAFLMRGYGRPKSIPKIQ